MSAPDRQGAAQMPPFSMLVIVFAGLLGHAALWCGGGIGRFVLPIAIGLALALRRPQLPRFDGWLPCTCALLGALAILYGSVATLDRSWDGFASWTLTARHLAAGEGLDDAFFANPSVYQSARGYPLLQPILLQQTMLWFGERGGRTLFPVLWVLLLLAVQEPLRRLGQGARQRALCIVGLAVVPMLIEPGHGSAESGFAELLLALVLAHGAAAIVLRQSALALCVGLCLPLVKEEGLVHACLLIAAAAWWQGPRLGAAFALGTGLALAIWLPMQQRILFAQNPFSAATLLTVLTPIGVLGWASALHTPRTRRIALLATIALPMAVVGLGPLLPASLGRFSQSAMTHWPSWSSIAATLTTLAQNLAWARKVGLSYLLFAGIAWFGWRTRRQPESRWALAAPLVGVQLAWLLFLALFLLTLPADRQPLFLKEGTPRYLIQTIGVVWLLIGLLLRADPERDVPRAPATPQA